MSHPSSALIVYLSILKFLDAGAKALEKLGQSADSSQDITDAERTAHALKDDESAQDTTTVHSSSAPQAKQTEPEKAVQSIHEKVKKFADRLIPALQPLKRIRSSTSSKSGDHAKKEKGEAEKLRKELETIRVDCATSLIQLLSE